MKIIIILSLSVLWLALVVAWYFPEVARHIDFSDTVLTTVIIAMGLYMMLIKNK